MSDEKVIVTKSKLDSLATSISNKSGVETPLTIAEMKTAVDSISTGGGGGGTITIEEIPNATGTTLQITTNGSDDSVLSLQAKSVSYTPTTSTQNVQVTADSGYDGLNTVDVSIGAIPSEYIVPSGTFSITENGSYNVETFARAEVMTSREDLTDPKDVDIIDYDGQLLYSYTAQEFLALDSLPANPTNKGLIAQGWNWTLADAQDFVRQHGALVIGQNYTTDNGRTKIYITVTQTIVDYHKGFEVRFYLDASSSATVYWGDGTSDDFSTTTAGQGKIATHYYTQKGKKVIEIDVTSGQMHIGYYGANIGLIGNDYQMRVLVDKIEVGAGVPKLARQPFTCLPNMKSVSLPITLTEVDQTVDSNMFADCTLLKAVVFPPGFVGRERGWFSASVRGMLTYLSFPKSMTKFQIGSNYRLLRKFTMYFYDIPSDNTKWYLNLYDSNLLTHFVTPTDAQNISGDTCRSSYIKKLVISETITSIAATAFAYNSHLEEIHMLPTTPPTLVNVSAFKSMPASCVIYVPYSADHSILSAYQNATNWSTYASQMQEESQ